MKPKFWKSTPNVVALALALAMIPNAIAQCMSQKALKPASWRSSPLVGARLVHAAFHKPDDDDDGPSIVGMWHVKFTVQTIDGLPVNRAGDDAIVVWHSDGTEIMNSKRPPQDGSFCLGVWAKVGKLKYVLNHIPWGGNDTSNAPGGIGNPEAGHQILEAINLNPDGNSYSGNFTARAYDQNKQPGPLVTGVLTATRITTTTSITDLF